MDQRTNDGPPESGDELAELAIDAVFGGDAPSEDGSSMGDGVAPEVHELEALRAACREALGAGASLPAEAAAAERASETLRVARVARRILARTTREDLGRKGDVTLMLDFVSERLRDSAVLRVAVALLIAQCTIVPLVAWHMLKTPEVAGFPIIFEPREGPGDEIDTGGADSRDIVAEDVVGGTDWSSLEDTLGRLDQIESVARGRVLLTTAARRATERAGAVPISDLGRSLAGLGGDLRSDTRAEGVLRPGQAKVPADLAGAVIAVELGLQRLSDTGAWRGLPEALDTLAEQVQSERATSRGLELAGRAFAHARLLDVAIPSLPERVAGVLPDGLSAGQLPADWLNALASEIQSAESSDPFVLAWIDVVREL